MSKYNVGLKTLLQQDLSELEFHDNLVYKFIKVVSKPIFRANLKILSLAIKR